MEPEPIGLGPRIRKAREAMGLSQAELARRAGTSIPQLNRLENGTRADPGLQLLKRLARALGVSLDYLGEMKPESDLTSVVSV
jgi:transcriptional regulator with XRE-family HTH domain